MPLQTLQRVGKGEAALRRLLQGPLTAIGAEFGQNAIVVERAATPARLLWVSGRRGAEEGG
jgi:hypothetical protein